MYFFLLTTFKKTVLIIFAIVALLLSTSKRPVQKPGEGQQLMKDLSDYLTSQFKISAPEFE